MSSPVGLRDLRGLLQLAGQATIATTDIVDGVHQSVRRLFGLRGREARSGGIPGLAYDSVRALAAGIVAGGDRALRALETLVDIEDDDSDAAASIDAARAALNGVVGDHLVWHGNPLALPMTLREPGGRRHDPRTLAGADVLLLVHGLCMNDRQWRAPDGFDLGRQLGARIGARPLYLRYNSGRHVAANGRDLSALLEQLLAGQASANGRLYIVGHSMGGLVTRAAVHHAETRGAAWLDRLGAVVCLGTPHHGAPLERAGSHVDALLERWRFGAPFARLGQLRSAGITDLRYGNVLHEWPPGRARFSADRARIDTPPLCRRVRWHAIAATTAASARAVAARVGDGLVPLDSALGRHADPARTLAFDACRVLTRTSHIDLMRSAAACEQMARWWRAPAGR